MLDAISIDGMSKNEEGVISSITHGTTSSFSELSSPHFAVCSSVITRYPSKSIRFSIMQKH